MPPGKMPELLLANRQRKVRFAELGRVEALAEAAVAYCLERHGRSKARLWDIDEVEISLVSNRVIARIHRRFMNIPGATDVITFSHGEIVVSAETASREASDRAENVDREVLRYIVHGLLHLNGHEDAEPDEAAAMWSDQETVVEQLWPGGRPELVHIV